MWAPRLLLQGGGSSGGGGVLARAALRPLAVLPAWGRCARVEARCLSAGTPAGGEPGRLGGAWRTVRNSQGRVFYEHVATGTRSWDPPSHAEAELLTAEEADKVAKRAQMRVDASEKFDDGGSLTMKLLNYWWSAVDLARRAYWVGIVAAVFYVGSELYKNNS
jgi:hypothetical protein